jgi:outer membrane scaffolding protein for murein synthesis (MipA/OmpV family)
MARADAPGLVFMRACVLAAGCCAAAPVLSEGKELLPVWELGIGLAYTRLPDYRGSDEAHGYVLPFPLIVYRGDFFKSDREGVRAQFLDSRYVEIELSAGATVPVNSKKNKARQGMPDLRPTLELGPAVKVHLAYAGEQAPGDRDFELDFRVPVRAALTWDNGPRDVGFLTFPSLAMDNRVRFAGSRWNLGVVAGGYFANQRYHHYFYGVPAEFATPERPAYTAHGGFGGWQAIAAISTTYSKRTWVGAFIKYDYLKGATFDNSPLVRQNTNIAFGIGVSHIFATSDQLVEAGR